MVAIQFACAVAAISVAAALMIRGGLLAGCLLVMLSTTCLGHAFYFLPTYPVPLTADRALAAGLVLQYIIYRRLGWSEHKPMRPADWLLAALLAVIVVSTFTHDWKVQNHQPLSDVLFQFLMPSALYWVARQSAVSRRQVAWLLGGMAVFGLYLALTAICEAHGLWKFVYPPYIGDAVKHPEFFGRSRGPLLNPIANGFVMTACLAAALLHWPRCGRCGQFVIVVTVPIYLIGLSHTMTRSVWLGAAAAAVVLAAMNLPRAWRWKLVATTGLMAVVLAAANWERLLAFKRDRNVSAREVADSVELRPVLAVVAWNMFLDRPLLGCGFGQYDRQSVYYLADRSSGLVLEKARGYVQHNTFLGLLTEVGLVGLSLYVAVLTLWTRDAWRLWNRTDAPLWARQTGLLFLAAATAYVASALFHDLTLMPAVTMLLFTLSGVVSSLNNQVSQLAVGPRSVTK